MNTAMHTVSAEEIMSLLDGELATSDAQALSAHLEQCSACREIAIELQESSQALSGWVVPPAPPRLDQAVGAAARKVAAGRVAERPRAAILPRLRVRPWTVGATGAMAAVLIAAILYTTLSYTTGHGGDHARYEMETTTSPAPAPPLPPGAMGSTAVRVATPEKPVAQATADKGGATDGYTPQASRPASMIARTVSLNLLVKNIAASRTSLDKLLAQRHGYMAQLIMNTPEAGPRGFEASLRVPAAELPAALQDFRALGRVQMETQSAEEISPQHADLVARLMNARATEQRLRDLLEHRTGKMEEVLAVEEQISTVRGDIEAMEAEQKNLEHRVEYATIDLNLSETYTAQLYSASKPFGATMHNAFVAGLQKAGGSLLSLLLFIEEFGPVLLVWSTILLLPAALLVRRYRKARARL